MAGADRLGRECPRLSAEPAPEPRLALTAVGTTLTLDEIAALRARLQRAMSGHVGVVRDAAGLTRAREEIENIAAELRLESAGETRENDPKTRRAFWELRNLVDAAQAVIEAAAHREESHGRTTAPIFQTAIPPSMESSRSGKLMVRFATAP